MKRKDAGFRKRKSNKNGSTKLRSFFVETKNNNEQFTSNHSGFTDNFSIYAKNGNEEKGVKSRREVHIRGGLMRRTLTKALIRHYNEQNQMN
jgi:hypothetical protein